MIHYPIKLSTTEPNNPIGVVKVRQDDKGTQKLVARITTNSKIQDLTGLEVAFNMRTTSGNVVIEKAVVKDEKLGIIEYVVSGFATQQLGRNIAYFTFFIGEEEQFSTKDFSYFVTSSVTSEGISGCDYIWKFEDLLEYVTDLANQSQVELDNLKSDFGTWFERIKDTLGEDAAGALAIAILDLEDRLNIRSTQTNKLGEMTRKLRLGELVEIACIGDSLTYGYDVSSEDIRPPASGTTDSGEVYNKTRAGRTYPEALKANLEEVFGAGEISVRNMGFSGDTTETAFQHWKASGADVALVMLGTNDAKTIPLADFYKYYRLLIEREISNNTAVLLLTPPRNKVNVDNRLDVTIQAIKQLATEYNIPYLDMIEATENISADNYSDGLHFNTKGYTFLGARIASFLISQSIQGKKLQGGDSLGAGHMTSGVLTDSTIQNAPGFPTPDEIEFGKGTALSLTPSKKAYYTFYAEEEDMLVYPSVYMLDSSTMKMTADFGVELPNMKSGYKRNATISEPDWRPKNGIIYSVKEANSSITGVFSYVNETTLDHSKCLHITTKGWHTIKIEAIGGSSGVRFHALDFVSYETMRLNEKMANVTKNTGWIVGATTGVANDSYAPVSYRKIGTKVELYGGGTFPTVQGTTFLILPEGFRPLKQIYRQAIIRDTSSSSKCLIQIETDGSCKIVTNSLASNAIRLDGIVFETV